MSEGESVDLAQLLVANPSNRLCLCSRKSIARDVDGVLGFWVSGWKADGLP
jgi:hypothetical protein